MMFSGNLTCFAGKSLEKVFLSFSFWNSNERTSVSNVILRSLIRNGAFLLVFLRILVLDSGFRVCVPECRPEKAVFQSAFAGSNLKRWIAD